MGEPLVSEEVTERLCIQLEKLEKLITRAQLLSEAEAQVAWRKENPE